MQGRRRRSLEVRRPILWLGATASIVLVLDQGSKAAVRSSLQLNESFAVIPGVLDLARVANTGAAFGLLPGRRELFIAISLLMLFGVAAYWVHERPRQWPVVIALGLVVGGAIGNLIDRAFVGRVTDFLAFSFFAPVFNIADSAIVVGVIVLVVLILFWSQDAPEEAPGTLVADPQGYEGDESRSTDLHVAEAEPTGPARNAQVNDTQIERGWSEEGAEEIL